MISSYTKENLDKLLKKDLIAISLTTQTKILADNAAVLEGIRKLNSKSDIIQSDLVVTENMNSEFPVG